MEHMEHLSNAGIDGLAVIVPNYEHGLEQLRDRILPLAVDAGVRVPVG